VFGMPTLGKMDPRWLRCGEHRGLRKRVLENSRLKDTITLFDSEGYSTDAEPKDSVDQDTVVNRCARSISRSFMTERGREGCAQEQDCLQYCFQVIISNSPRTGCRGLHGFACRAQV